MSKCLSEEGLGRGHGLVGLRVRTSLNLMAALECGGVLRLDK